MSECITKVFGLEDVTVEGVQERGDGWLVTVRYGPPGPCARCGQDRCHRHGRGPRRPPVAHAWIGHRPIHLTWIPQRWRYASCGRTQTPCPARLGPWQRWTPLAQTAALQALRRDSFPGVAQGLGLGPGRLRRLVDRTVPREDDTWWTLRGDLVLSVDAPSVRGPELLITVALQAPVRRLLTILPDGRLRTLEAWLARILEAVRQRIRVATADLKRGYATVLARWCPPVRVVADPFHVIRDANARLDAGRRLEQSEARHAIPRWPLVKGADRLTARSAPSGRPFRPRIPRWAP